MTRPANAYVAISLAALFAGCAAPASKVRVDQAEGGLPNCQTFAWHAVSGDAASLADQRVRAAVLEELKAKGYAENAEKPDCRITYHLATREIPKSKPGVGVGVGGGSGGVGGGIGISLPIGRKDGYTGTFTLDVIDGAKNAQVWSGSTDVEIESAEITDRDAVSLAKDVLQAYPDRKE